MSLLQVIALIITPRAHVQLQCRRVCVRVCVSKKKIFKNASSRVARAFKDVILNEKQPTESYWNISVPDTSQGGSFRHYFSYFLLSVS